MKQIACLSCHFDAALHVLARGLFEFGAVCGQIAHTVYIQKHRINC